MAANVVLADMTSDVISVVLVAEALAIVVVVPLLALMVRWLNGVDRRLGIGAYFEDPFAPTVTLADALAISRRKVLRRIALMTILMTAFTAVGELLIGFMLYSTTGRSDAISFLTHALFFGMGIVALCVIPIAVVVYFTEQANTIDEYRYWRSSAVNNQG